MKAIFTLLLLCFLASLAVADETTVIRLSEPVAADETSETYGALLNDSASVVRLSALLERPRDFVDTALRVDTRVAEVCQKKGCFYIATDGKHNIRVSFKDYGFFLPTDIGGKTVTLTGTLIKRERSESEAEHFREDAKSDAIQAGTVYELIADAVRIPTSQS